MLDRLFVYGSLRRTGNNIHPLLGPATRFVSMARCRGVMYDLGPFPAVVSSPHAEDVVLGELYRLGRPQDVLRRLDAYEGSLFARERHDVTTEEGVQTDAWIYRYTGPLGEAVRVASGDYRML